METEQLYYNGTPFFPKTNYEADNAKEKIEDMQKKIQDENTDIDFSTFFQ